MPTRKQQQRDAYRTARALERKLDAIAEKLSVAVPMAGEMLTGGSAGERRRALARARKLANQLGVLLAQAEGLEYVEVDVDVDDLADE